MSRVRREAPSAEHMIEVLRDGLFALPAFALFANVRSAVGVQPPGLRIADVIAADTKDGPELALHGLEIKRTAGDLARELANPAKAEGIGRYCESFSLVVPAPWKRTLASKALLPRAWGLIEVDGGHAEHVVYAEKRSAEPPPAGFLKALLRAAAAPVLRELRGEGDAKPRAIGGQLDRQRVWFEGCLHVQLAPLAKHLPAKAPCFSCAENLPAHPDAIAAALEASDAMNLERLRERIDRLLGVRVPMGPALVSCGAPAAAPEVAHG